MPDGSVKSKNKSLEINLKLKYMPGFGNDFETEALVGALPQGMNSRLYSKFLNTEPTWLNILATTSFPCHSFQ